MLKPVYKDLKLLVYKADTYKSQEKDKWLVKRIINHKDIDDKI